MRMDAPTQELVVYHAEHEYRRRRIRKLTILPFEPFIDQLRAATRGERMLVSAIASVVAVGKDWGQPQRCWVPLTVCGSGVGNRRIQHMGTKGMHEVNESGDDLAKQYTTDVLFTHIVTRFILIVAPAMIKALGLGLWQEHHDDDSLVCRSHDALSVAAYPSRLVESPVCGDHPALTGMGQKMESTPWFPTPSRSADGLPKPVASTQNPRIPLDGARDHPYFGVTRYAVSPVQPRRWGQNHSGLSPA